MSVDTIRRKADHIRIALRRNVQAKTVTTGFEDVDFVHKTLPEVDREKTELATTVFGHDFSAPLIVGAITGGTQAASKINATIAETVEELGLGMGVGSQRAAIEDARLEKTFAVARKMAPTAFLIANIGGIQLLNGYGLKEVKKIIEMIQADAVAIHLNALQETTQPEGQTNFNGILARIREIVEDLEKPVIVKETGAGIAAEEGARLQAAGVKGIDVSGAGGTSFAAVEHYRTSRKKNDPQRRTGDVFWDWGIPTAISVIEVAQTVHIPVIASGGVRTGMDVAKSLAMGASLAGISHPMLQSAVEGKAATHSKLLQLINEIRNTMFLTGAKSVKDLHATPIVITGKTSEWLRARGFSIEDYARRGMNKL